MKNTDVWSINMKPMLAVEAPEKIQFPVYASPKLDGIRAFIKDDLVMARSMKPIPNEHIQACLGHSILNGLDGELIVGEWNHPNVMQATESGVMTREGVPDFTFWIFDFYTAPSMIYGERLRLMMRAINDGVLNAHPNVRLLGQTLISNASELAAYEKQTLEDGFEGVILRAPKGIYKFGRSTAREGYMLKLKRFTDSEAVVLDVKELMHNANSAKRNELGYTARSSHKENKVPMGTLGAIIAKDIHNGMDVDIGTGFTAKQRSELWKLWLSGKLQDRIVKYKYFDKGMKDKPRHPVFIGFRDPIDIGE